jgi:hypothetical protein
LNENVEKIEKAINDQEAMVSLIQKKLLYVLRRKENERGNTVIFNS